MAKTETTEKSTSDEGNVAPPRQADSLYDKIGGETSIKAVVENFYERLLGDASLAPVFAGVDLGRLKRHQALFISQALGGPKEYSGRSMFAAHKNLLVTEGQFGQVAAHLQATLEHFQVPQGDLQTILGVVGSLKNDIVTDHFTRWLRGG